MSDEMTCATCRHSNKSMVESPCLECTNNRATNNYQPMTNGDKIRQASDEDLAMLIMCPYGASGEDCEGSCMECTLKWLREVAES